MDYILSDIICLSPRNIKGRKQNPKTPYRIKHKLKTPLQVNVNETYYNNIRPYPHHSMPFQGRSVRATLGNQLQTSRCRFKAAQNATPVNMQLRCLLLHALPRGIQHHQCVPPGPQQSKEHTATQSSSSSL